MTGFSAASERNKQPILERLAELFVDCGTVLEIGSGAGQHAVHCGTHLPHLRWQPTERPEHMAVLQASIAAAGLLNVLAPVALDVRDEPWPFTSASIDAVFSANTLHIMSWACVEAFFRGVGAVTGSGGRVCVYGPFLYRNIQPVASNREFDRSLRARDPDSGLREFEAVDALACAQGLRLAQDLPMPANNRLLVWDRC